MGNTTNINKWSVERYEVSTGYEKVAHASRWYFPSSAPFKLYIPKLMPLISAGIPKITPSSLSNGCFANDSSCKPHIPSTISTQNYITVPHRDNRPFEYSWIPTGSQVQVEIDDNDVDNIWVSNRIDPSSLFI